LQDFYHDPERLKQPIKKTNEGWKKISWEKAFSEITEKIKATQKKHGIDAVGVYLGNPNAHNFGNALFLPRFFKALGSKNRYSSASADQLPHHVAANYMFGVVITGISINTLTSANRINVLTGNAAFNGTPVSIEPI